MALPLREARDLFETQYLQAQLLRFGGNISRTAQFVGMERSALHRKLKRSASRRRTGRIRSWRRRTGRLCSAGGASLRRRSQVRTFRTP